MDWQPPALGTCMRGALTRLAEGATVHWVRA